MSHKIEAGLDKNLPKETDLAVKLIVALTGEDPSKFIKMSEDEIFQHLAYLMKCEKEKILDLLREHDQNEELDLVKLAALWKLNARGIVKGKGRHSPLGSTPKEFFEKILLLMGQRADLVDKMLAQGGGALTSEMLNNTKPISTKKLSDVLKLPVHAVRAVVGSNDNSNSGRSF